MPPPTPTNHDFFDPWNSSATGHQRAENPYSNTTSWRETRRAKLAIQFAGDNTKTNSGSGNGAQMQGYPDDDGDEQETCFCFCF
ncbi:hypothetical protein CNMCM5623_002957 [Aspergillus felis]|uniref:Uncharacterized protein n=1 Tax=Aspergillus felis TaxID=1287682 RepID=A0A8H6QB95_9EURO|nr:hypothetical protein CNMCM5623_002957 [Aspergillus felis]